jgi:AcrR family transcriptional regulator
MDERRIAESRDVAEATPETPAHRSRVSGEEASERLIETTIDMLREVPFTELSVRTITARADLNKSTVERCFGSIEMLYREASLRLMTQALSKLAETPDASPFGDPDFALATRFRAWLVTGGVDGRVFRPASDEPIVELMTARQRRHSGVSPLTSQTFHYAVALLVEGFTVFDETLRSNKDVHFNLLLMMNEFISRLPDIESSLGWTDRAAVDVDVDIHPDTP